MSTIVFPLHHSPCRRRHQHGTHSRESPDLKHYPLDKAFVASVGHLSDEKKLDLRVLHGDGTTTVAKKGETGLATRATSTRRGRKSSPSPTTMATCCLPSQWHPSMRRTCSCG